MSRIVKEYDERYNEFLDVAQTLFYSKGYEQTSVQEIIDMVGVAKGTFYHYFSAKVELLDALVERMYAQTVATLEPMVADESLNAAEKLERFFAYFGDWKATHRQFVLDTARVLYQDENVLLRTKMMAESTEMAVPLLAEIIRQGVDEGTFVVPYSDEAAEIIFKMGQALSEGMVPLVLQKEWEDGDVHRLERKIVAYNRSVARVLGAAEDSICLVDLDDLSVWLPQKGGSTDQSERGRVEAQSQ